MVKVSIARFQMPSQIAVDWNWLDKDAFGVQSTPSET
jgi:hypothetical protein